jgi:hypothetical protein
MAAASVVMAQSTRVIDAMTDQDRIALLRRALAGLLAVIDEDYPPESQADEPRILDAHLALTATDSSTKELAAVPEFIGDHSADVPVLILYEAQVVDEGGEYSTRHFAWTKAKALSAATTRAAELITQLHRHPMNVHTGEALEHTIAFTKDGLLKFLNDEFGDLT